MKTMIMSSDALAHWISEFHLASCEKEDVDNVRLRILDYLISAAAGKKCNWAYSDAVEAVYLSFDSASQSQILFSKTKAAAPIAAYLNATYGHGADLDDGHRLANGHPGVTVIPAVLALGQAENAASDRIFEAILVGYETYIRVSEAVQPNLLHRGFHGTGVVGAVAASAACAKLIGLQERQIHHAISLGAVQASGLFEVSESGQSAKPINPANACRVGVESALLARQGVEAPRQPFEGAKGFFHAFAGEGKPEAIVDGLGQSLRIRECYVKLSPACRHVHPEIDAGITLGQRRRIEASEIQKIEIHTYPNAIFVTGKICCPKNSGEAKFSMRYALAMALRKGRYSLAELESLPDAEALALMEKMELIAEQAFENPGEGIRGCEVQIIFVDGARDQCYVKIPRGEQENPLTAADLESKLHSCCDGVWSREQQVRLYQAVMQDGPLNPQELMKLTVSDALAKE